MAWYIEENPEGWSERQFRITDDEGAEVMPFGTREKAARLFGQHELSTAIQRAVEIMIRFPDGRATGPARLRHEPKGMTAYGRFFDEASRRAKAGEHWNAIWGAKFDELMGEDDEGEAGEDASRPVIHARDCLTHAGKLGKLLVIPANAAFDGSPATTELIDEEYGRRTINMSSANLEFTSWWYPCDENGKAL